jgi:hypothetical protein
MGQKPQQNGGEHALSTIVVEGREDAPHDVEVAMDLSFGFHVASPLN